MQLFPLTPEPGLTRDATSSLAEQLAARFAQRIGQRLMTPGARLPSVRACAKSHGVSPTTVVGAYDLLQAQGLVEARPQRGFFVRRAASLVQPAAQRAGPPPLPLPVDATALIRSMFQVQGGLPAPAMGMLPVEWLDATLLQRALRRVAAADANQWLRYGDPAGDLGLRCALSHRLADLAVEILMPRDERKSALARFGDEFRKHISTEILHLIHDQRKHVVHRFTLITLACVNHEFRDEHRA